MEAANRGAFDIGAKSIGMNITIPREQEPNPYMDTWVDFDYFFVRKVLLLKYSYGFIIMPGGFGTMDEMMEVLTLLQTGKIKKPLKVIIYDSNYWSKIINFNFFFILTFL